GDNATSDVASGDGDSATSDRADASVVYDGGLNCEAGQVPTGDACAPLPPAAPRLLAPLSTATVTSRKPTLHWVLAPDTDGAHVQICRDRACSVVVTEFDAVGDHGAPASSLDPGVVFWRAYGRSGGRMGVTASYTWQFVVGARTAPVDISWGATA